jgi:lipopolysaccharide/colanic/teichoic acid biosynthesis glycosyltransferase
MDLPIGAMANWPETKSMPDTIYNEPISEPVMECNGILLGSPYDVKPTNSFLIQKWLLDYMVASILLIILAIPLVVIAVAIKLDSPGPVFFRQPRVGFRNQSFMIWKFRTMWCVAADIEGSRLTLRNDPRITRFGGLLRKCSLDEVPQLFNVLVGDMSLVGPRPHPIWAKAGDRLYCEVVPNYAARHAVKPGITGWAQINGWRGETIESYQIEQRVAFDMEYISKRSIRLDLWIMVLTVAREIHSKTAF